MQQTGQARAAVPRRRCSAWSGYFTQSVRVNNTLSCNTLVATNKYFLIDHPLDPANKFLLHSSVESPDTKNLYDGIATLDSSGNAVVALPKYFVTARAV